jgi:hypothetical protein
MASKSYGIVMWDNENGRCSVVLLNEIYKQDNEEKLIVGKKYTVKYGDENYEAVLKMIGM